MSCTVLSVPVTTSVNSSDIAMMSELAWETYKREHQKEWNPDWKPDDPLIDPRYIA